MDMEKQRKRWGDEEDLSLHLHKQGCLIQILVWLPVLSLLRFKTVNRFWRDLIQSPFFIDLHATAITTLNSSDSSSEFGSFILHVIYDEFCPPPNSSVSYYRPLLMLSSQSDSESESVSVSISGGVGGSNDDLLMLSSQSDSESESVSVSISGGVGGSNDDDQVVVDDLVFDMKNKKIVGSCNGLVCTLDDRNCQPGSLEPDEVSLFNPATGQGATLPESLTIPGGVSSLVVFGYDLETKDYKVVQFTRLKPRWNENGNEQEFCFCRVQVYSLSTDSWRLLEGIPCLPGYPFLYPDSVVYLNGTCFFLAHYFHTRRNPCLAENDRFIISFDFTKEIITPIQLPDHHRNQELCLCSLGDKIALFTSPNPLFSDDSRIRNCEDFNIWVLNYERGSSVNKESWKKLHSFQLQLESQDKWYTPSYWFQLQLESQDKWYTPSGISNDGKFAILTSEYGNKMNLYKFATKEVKRDFLVCRKVMSKAHAYKPSLVSVIGGAGSSSSSSSR